MNEQPIQEDIIFIFSPAYQPIEGFLHKVEEWLADHRCGHLHRSTSRSLGREINHVFVRSDRAKLALTTFWELAARENRQEWAWDYRSEITHIPMKRNLSHEQEHLYP